MLTIVKTEEFITLAANHPILDVRTPAEYEQGHMPGAINFPLFTNEERKIIGTLYKQEGKQPAILKGLEMVGPRLKTMVVDVVKILKNANHSQTVLIHCWRGGMRSSSMAWLFSSYGIDCYVLKGGYKAYRKSVLSGFTRQLKLSVIGGKTGSGKTEVLKCLEELGEQFIDLENISHHKGSSFGALGEQKQNTQEQFENNLFSEYSKVNSSTNCWIEDESRKIGTNVIPESLWNQMRLSRTYYIELPTRERVNYLVKEYGKHSKAELQEAVARIGKKLGGLQLKQTLDALEENNLTTACENILLYYDKTYTFGLQKRNTSNITTLTFEKMDFNAIANRLKQEATNV